MEHAYTHLLHLLAGHPAWTLAAVFVFAFLESIAIIGTFVPGSTALFVAGALVGTGALNLGSVFACAIVGAVAGDSMSYRLGRHYKAKIVEVWPLRTHPRMLDAAHRFFAKHGAKSVVFARFIGPLRAIVPVVAGMLGMPSSRFYTMNVLSALLWAPVSILPGVVFGASIQLAGAVSFRLVVIIALLVGIVWLGFRTTRILLSLANTWTTEAGPHLAAWGRRHKGRTGSLALRLLDPGKPILVAISVASVVVLLSGCLFFGILDDVISGAPLVHIDASVFHFLQSVRTPWSDAVLSALETPGSVTTLATLVITVVLWLLWECRWRTLGYWLAAVAFSQLLIFAIQLATHRPPVSSLPSDAYAFPSNDFAAAVIVYGFLAFMLTRRVGPLVGILVVATSLVIVLFVALASLYFGRFGLSDAIGGGAFASIWVAMVALTAVWRHPVVPSRKFMPPLILLVVCGSVALQLEGDRQTRQSDSTRRATPVLVTESQWTNSLWKQLPCYRSDMEGDRKEGLTVQWPANAGEIRSRLRVRGWVEGTNLSAQSLLSLASPNVAAMALPVLPKLDNGVPSPLVFAHPGNTRDERDVLRFWSSDYAIEHRGGTAPSHIWIGAVVHERLYRPSWPINILLEASNADPRPGADGGWLSALGLVVLARENCQGVPVALMVSGEG